METGNDGSKGVTLKWNNFKKREPVVTGKVFFTFTFNLLQVIIKVSTKKGTSPCD